MTRAAKAKAAAKAALDGERIWDGTLPPPYIERRTPLEELAEIEERRRERGKMHYHYESNDYAQAWRWCESIWR